MHLKWIAACAVVALFGCIDNVDEGEAASPIGIQLPPMPTVVRTPAELQYALAHGKLDLFIPSDVSMNLNDVAPVYLPAGTVVEYQVDALMYSAGRCAGCRS